MELLQRSAAKIQREATTISLQDYTSGEATNGMEMDHISGLETETEGHDSHEMQPLYKQVVASVEGMLEKLTPLSAECCIYTVPQKLRKVEEEAYEPRVVSIGPLHHGKKHLVAMEEHKLRYLQNFLSRSHKTMKDYVKIISNLERNIRDSYCESIKLSSEDFLKMILVDGCFIIEVILLSLYHNLREPNDRVYNKPWLIHDVRRDMTLLENQLPFFILQSLYNLAFPKNDCLEFLTLSIQFLDYCMQMPEMKSYQELIGFARKISSTYVVKHFVDLLRTCQLPSSLRSKRDPSKRINTMIPTAIELHEAGVRFKLGLEGKSLLDIEYKSDGVLKIPKLLLEDKCESLFRNLIAFEQCHYGEDTYITDYIHLMDHLINTTKDVDILVKGGIIENWLGDNGAVMNMFNKLLINTELYCESFYFAGIFEGLNAYCNVPRNRWKAALRHDYFSSPWRGASTIAAVILLVLTLIQTIFSGMSIK